MEKKQSLDQVMMATIAEQNCEPKSKRQLASGDGPVPDISVNTIPVSCDSERSNQGHNYLRHSTSSVSKKQGSRKKSLKKNREHSHHTAEETRSPSSAHGEYEVENAKVKAKSSKKSHRHFSDESSSDADSETEETRVDKRRGKRMHTKHHKASSSDEDQQPERGRRDGKKGSPPRISTENSSGEETDEREDKRKVKGKKSPNRSYSNSESSGEERERRDKRKNGKSLALSTYGTRKVSSSSDEERGRRKTKRKSLKQPREERRHRSRERRPERDRDDEESGRSRSSDREKDKVIGKKDPKFKEEDSECEAPKSRKERSKTPERKSSHSRIGNADSSSGEELENLHKQIETLKNMTKRLEHKLEVLEHKEESSSDEEEHHKQKRNIRRSTDHLHHEAEKREKLRPLKTHTEPDFTGHKYSRKIGTQAPDTHTTSRTKNGRDKGMPHSASVPALNVLHSKYDGDKRKKELKRSKEKHNNREVNVDEDEEGKLHRSGGSSPRKKVDRNDHERSLRRSLSLTDVYNEKKEKEIEKDRPLSKHHHHPHPPFASPFGNTENSKHLECFSCLIKTEIPSHDHKKKWKRRVIGFDTHGMTLLKPYTEAIVEEWVWRSIKQWVINGEQNLIKFMVEEEADSDSERSSDEDRRDGSSDKDEESKVHIVTYTFRVDDVKKVNHVVQRIIRKLKKGRKKSGDEHSDGSSSSPSDSDDNHKGALENLATHAHSFLKIFSRHKEHHRERDKRKEGH